jgi:hypothetical protein
MLSARAVERDLTDRRQLIEWRQGEVFSRGVYTGLSVASGEPKDFLNVADNLGAGLLGCFENNARLVFVTGNVVAFKQHPLDGVINSRRLVDRLTGERLVGDLTPQSLIVSRRDFNEYIHGVTSLWLRRVNSLNGSNVQSLQARATAIWNGTSRSAVER